MKSHRGTLFRIIRLCPKNYFMSVIVAAIISISKIWIQVTTSKTIDHAVAAIKKQGVLIPIFATLIGWAGTVCAYLLLRSIDKVDRFTSAIQ